MLFIIKTEKLYMDNPLGSPYLITAYETSLKKMFPRGDITALASYKEVLGTTDVTQLALPANSGSQKRKVYSAGFTSKYEMLDKLNAILGLTYNYYSTEQSHSISRQYLVNSGISYDFGNEFTASLNYYYSNFSSAQIAADNRNVNRVILELKKVF